MVELLKLVSLCVISRELVVPTKTFNYTQNLRFSKPETEALPPALPCWSYPGKRYPPYASTTARNTALPILLILPHIRPSALHRHKNWELYPVPVTI